MIPDPNKSFFPDPIPSRTADDIVSSARKYMGLRFQHQGRGIYEQGIDCAGLIVRTADDLGLPWADNPASYGQWPDREQIIEVLRMSMDEQDELEVFVGCVAVFCVPGFAVEGRQPQHLAIVSSVEPFHIIHAYGATSFRKVVEHSAPKKWDMNITHIFKFRGVA